MENKIPYIDDTISKKVDEELMSTYQYSIDQLMEIAGLTVAKAESIAAYCTVSF